MKLRSLLLASLLIAAPAFGADVDGKWTGSVDTPGGPVQVNYTFKAEGAKLTGSTTGPDGNVVPIKNGKVEGNKIAFAIDLDFGQGPMTLNYTGVVAPTEIKMLSEVMGQTIEFSVKKAT
jgi:hypothetical protein